MISFMDFILAIITYIGIAVIFVAKYYKKCLPNEVIAVYGIGIKNRGFKYVHSGGVFVWPLIQNYGVLSLETMTANINAQKALCKGNILLNISAKFIYSISPSQELLQNAAEKLLNLDTDGIAYIASDILMGQLRLTTAQSTIKEINGNNGKFIEQVITDANSELNKLGLSVIKANITNVTEISDTHKQNQNNING